MAHVEPLLLCDYAGPTPTLFQVKLLRAFLRRVVLYRELVILGETNFPRPSWLEYRSEERARRLKAGFGDNNSIGDARTGRTL
jgi:hypothetical protein